MKLLRVLETRSFERVGGVEAITTKARLISATNRNLMELVKEGTFREDLFYRLDVVNIKLPALRERAEDIPVLVEKFIAEFSGDNEKKITGISDAAMEILQNIHGRVISANCATALNAWSYYVPAKLWIQITCRKMSVQTKTEAKKIQKTLWT